MNGKYGNLIKNLAGLDSVAVAFSSGVDSTLLLAAAVDALGSGKVVAVTARSCSFPERELNEAKKFCADRGIEHVIVDSEELDIEGFAQNPKNRCYLCKSELFSKIRRVAEQKGYKHILEGSNTDDDGDYRPGLIAVREQGVLSPLREAGLSKDEIREISKELGLPTWRKQSFACLSSRFVYGETITEEKLGRVDRAEQFLLDEGFTQVRVRVHGDIARIELLPAEFPKLTAIAEKTNKTLKDIGFAYVSLDLGGYRTGSMNDTLGNVE